MEQINARKNRIITHLRSLAADSTYRREFGEFLCDGEKLLQEARNSGAEVKAILWAEKPAFAVPEVAAQFCCPLELLQYASPLKNSQGPVFSVAMAVPAPSPPPGSILVLENVQDPGNVGTVIRTANALGLGTVVLVGDCADLYNPKTVRATMGAIFRQHILEQELQELKDYVNQNGLKLYAAAMREDATDIRSLELSRAAVCIGSEGSGLTEKLLALCESSLIIPMAPGSESLNAAVAASIVMWEMVRS